MSFASRLRQLGAGLLLLAAAGLACGTAGAAPAGVTVENHSRPTACAEEDNVSLLLRGQGIVRFRVEALQPPYLASIHDDRTAPDFSGCNFDGGVHPTDPAYRFEPRTVVLHEDARWRIVGMTLPSFWRPNRVPVRVGARSGDDFHLLQVFAKHGSEKPMEVLVMYPADGYWRIKPLPLPGFGDGAYGSSFLLGPVQDGPRPVVDIASIRVELAPLAIRLRFTDGGSAEVRLGEVSRVRTALDVRLHPPTRAAQPFAVLRSMYVAPDNADVAVVGWRAPGSGSGPGEWQTLPLPELTTLAASDLLFGRTQPSKHNTSAPDIRFSGFATGR